MKSVTPGLYDDIMDKEHTFALFREPVGSKSGAVESPNGLVRGADSKIGAALTALEQARIHAMSQEDADQTLRVLGRIQSVAASLMCDVADMLAAAGTEADPVEALRQGTRMPTRESKRIAKMAKQLTDMPKVKERFATGDITPGHVNALANAAEKVGPETVNGDQGLLEAADRMPADTFGRHARKWSDQKLIDQGVDPLQRQRRAREAQLWVDKDSGLGVVMAKLPRPQFEQVRQAVDSHYLRLHRQDGADGRSPDAVRSPKQRLADTMFELLTGRSAHTGEPISDQVGMRAKASTQLVVTVPLGVIDGTDPGGQVEIIGAGPVPRRFLHTLSPDTELAGLIYDRAGRILWLGRNQRLGNAAQRLVVAIRDGGCFQCGAPMHRCELHHMEEWRRDGGRTDIDNLIARLPSAPQMARIQQPQSPADRQRLPDPPTSRSERQREASEAARTWLTDTPSR